MAKASTTNQWFQLIAEGTPESIGKYITENPECINTVNETTGQPALHLATSLNKSDVVNLLLDKGADWEKTCKYGEFLKFDDEKSYKLFVDHNLKNSPHLMAGAALENAPYPSASIRNTGKFIAPVEGTKVGQVDSQYVVLQPNSIDKWNALDLAIMHTIHTGNNSCQTALRDHGIIPSIPYDQHTNPNISPNVYTALMSTLGKKPDHPVNIPITAPIGRHVAQETSISKQQGGGYCSIL